MKQRITIEDYLNLSDAVVINYVKDKGPVIWHQMVLYWCVSFDTQFTNWLADNPKTSKATALLIYWKQGSSYFKKFKDREAFLAYAPESSPDYDLSRLIEDRYVAGFYKGENIYFDPCQPDPDGMIWSEEYANIEDVRGLPRILYEKLEGKIILENPDFIEGYPSGLEPLLNELRDSYEII